MPVSAVRHLASVTRSWLRLSTVRSGVGCFMAWLTAGLLRPIQPIAEIAESGHDELVFVQPLVDRRV